MSLPSRTITLPAGDLDWHTAMRLPDGVTLQGAGRDKTRIIWHGTFDDQTPGVSGCAIVPGNGCIVQDLGVIIKSHPYYAGCIGCRELDGDKPSVDVLLQRLGLTGQTDTIYIRHTGLCRWRLIDSGLYTQWDLIVLADALHELEVADSDLVADSRGFVISGSPQSANCTTILAGRLTLDTCNLTAQAPDNMQARALWTLDKGHIGHVPGSRIDVIGKGRITARTPKEQAPGTTIKVSLRTKINL